MRVATVARVSPRAHSTPHSVTRAKGAAELSLGAEPKAALTRDEESCPKCGGRMWDNRLTKRNPKAPDFKCRDCSCHGVIWPPKGDKAEKQVQAMIAAKDAMAEPHTDETEEIPFKL